LHWLWALQLNRRATAGKRARFFVKILLMFEF
jgi:hypothetical protein